MLTTNMLLRMGPTEGVRATMALYSGTFCNTFRYGGMNNVEASVLICCICIAIFAAALLMSYRKTQVESR